MGEPNRSPNDSDLVRVMETTAHQISQYGTGLALRTTAQAETMSAGECPLEGG